MTVRNNQLTKLSSYACTVSIEDGEKEYLSFFISAVVGYVFTRSLVLGSPFQISHFHTLTFRGQKIPEVKCGVSCLAHRR